MKYPLLIILVLTCCSAYATEKSGKRIISYIDSHAEVTLKGQVICAISKKPIASAITVEVDGAAPIQLTADVKGKFAAIVPISQAMKIVARAPGYEPTIFRYTLPARDTTIFIEILLKPRYELILEGIIVDAKTNQPIPGELDVYFDSDYIIEDVQIIEHGEFKEVVSKPGWYILEILSLGYLSISDTVWLVHEGTRSVHKKYSLTPIEVGLNVVIDNLYFYFGQVELKPESSKALDKVVEFVKKNPTVELEIAGHTDDEGDEDYNLMLSQGRAQAVVDYMVSVGIDATKLIARGYGETKPIDTTNTKEGKARNRRVEFTIIGK